MKTHEQAELEAYLFNGKYSDDPSIRLFLIGVAEEVEVLILPEMEVFSAREFMELNAHPEIWGSYEACCSWQLLRLAHLN